MFFFGNGEMAADEVLNHMEYPGEDYEPKESWRNYERDYDPTGRTSCRYCGAEDLTWDVVGKDKWRLFELNDQPHTCKEYFKHQRKEIVDDQE